MKKSRFTDEQIAFAFKQAETGTNIDEICRKMAISDATFYKWRQKYGGLGPSELRKLKQLEEDNSKLKRIVAGTWACKCSGSSAVAQHAPCTNC